MSIFRLLAGKPHHEKLSYSQIRKTFPIREDDLKKLVPADHGSLWSVGALRTYFDADAVEATVKAKVEARQPALTPTTSRNRY